jgi:hypothetical protein
MSISLGGKIIIKQMVIHTPINLVVHLSLPFMALLFSSYHQPQLYIPQSSIPWPRTWKIFQLLVNFQMYSLTTCQDAAKPRCRVHHRTATRYDTYIQTTIQDDTQGICRIEDTIEGTVGQGFHTSKFFTLGLPDIICHAEKSILEVMCRLLALERRDYQEQVSASPH